MNFYDEKGNLIPKESVDLDRGYLVDRTIVHHPKEGHRVTKEIFNLRISYFVVDKPAWDEVTEQTYILYADHPSESDKLEAQVFYTAVMTDTLLEE